MRRELILFGLVLGTISLAFAQDKPVNVPPNNPGVDAPFAPPPGDNPVEAPVAKPQELAVLYNGESKLPPQVVMAGWGYIQQDAAFKPFEPKRLKSSLHSPYYLYILSLGRYQGVRFDFPQPLPAAELLRAKNVYLEMYVRAYIDTSPPKTDAKTDAKPNSEGETILTPWTITDTKPPASATTTTTPGATPGGATSVNNDKQQQEAAYPKDMRTRPLTVPLPDVTSLRFTFYTEKGAAVFVVPVENFFPKEEIKHQWVRIGIPLATLDAAFPVGTNLTRLVITCDKPAAFCLGRLAFVKDVTPITIHPLIYPTFIEMGQRIFFASRPEFGLTHVETTWNFDNGNGSSVDVKGDRITYTFDKEGIYSVTCTVRDPEGGKEPVKQNVVVKVSRGAGASGGQ